MLLVKQNSGKCLLVLYKIKKNSVSMACAGPHLQIETITLNIFYLYLVLFLLWHPGVPHEFYRSLLVPVMCKATSADV